MQINTAISDLVLAIVSFWVGIKFLNAKRLSLKGSGWGLLSISAGAFLGVIYFLDYKSIEPIYRPIVQFAGIVGVPWIGIGFFDLALKRIIDKSWLVASLILCIGFFLDFFIGLGLYSTIIGAISFIVIIVSCLQFYKSQTKNATQGILGSLLFILAGLVIGTKGSMYGIQNVDIFHYMISIACYLLGSSLMNLSRQFQSRN
jgi:PTS system glucitol/sorbitol-specific IIB component